MKVKSLVRKGLHLEEVEVDLSLSKGLPQFQVLGRADAVIKESLIRVRTALANQGFQLPRGKRVLVNLRPSHIKKESRGLDLAIAYAYLGETKQINIRKNPSLIVYGELDLQGTVYCPDDLESYLNVRGDPVMTGPPSHESSHNLIVLQQLKDFLTREEKPVLAQCMRPIEWIPPDISFDEKWAKLATIVLAGEHSLLLAGPSGSGKTTLARAIAQSMLAPSEDQWSEIQNIARLFGEDSKSRPVIAPHHSIPPISMIGGGVPPFPGEITRAHGGSLLLDELLEYHHRVKEALREPIESGEINVSRRGKRICFPAKFLLLATSNLCPCGDLRPDHMVGCRFSLTKCRSYSERLSGPVLDRFQLLAVTGSYKGSSRNVLMREIKCMALEAKNFARKSRGQDIPNSHLSRRQVEGLVEPFTLQNLAPDVGGSERRWVSMLQVARTLADMEGRERVGPSHLQASYEWTVRPYSKIRDLHS